MPPRSLSMQSSPSWGDDYSLSSASVEVGKCNKDKPQSRNIRISEERQIFPITHLDDMTEEEIAETWYDANEYSEIKSNYQHTIFLMESNEKISDDDEDHTTRGLEYRTQDGAWARYENKRDAYNAVLDEQDRQWKVDKDDDEMIRKIYLDHSKKCADAAVVRALHDEREATRLHAEERAKLEAAVKKAAERRAKKMLEKKKLKKHLSMGSTKSKSPGDDKSTTSKKSTGSKSTKTSKSKTKKDKGKSTTEKTKKKKSKSIEDGSVSLKKRLEEDALRQRRCVC